MRKLFTLLLALSMMASVKAQTVYEIIQNSPNHTTLETAIDAAGLGATLSGTGPFTVFAPDDAAFAALPAGVLDDLLADAAGALTDVLLYHVLSGSVLSTDLLPGMNPATVNGAQVLIDINTDGIFINQARVTTGNIPADNGVIHVTNTVITPPTTINDFVKWSPLFTTLSSVLELTELDMAIEGDGPFTLFAPTDAVFDSYPEELISSLVADPDNLLRRILLHHVYAGQTLAGDLSDGQILTSLAGKTSEISIDGSEVTIQDAIIDEVDIFSPNGVMHIIDELLIPADKTVLETVQIDEELSTLETAAGAAGFAPALGDADREFIVFAPNNAAFDALPAGALDALLDDPMGDLARVLGFHVVEDDPLLSFDFEDGDEFESLQGQLLRVTKDDDGNLFVNGIKIIRPDLLSENGVVHVIEGVLLPGPATVVDIVVASEAHTTLETAVIEAELITALSGDGPFTIFAPDDAAFAALPTGTLDALLADPTGELAQILQLHVVADEIFSFDLEDGDELTSLTGEILNITINGDGAFVNGTKITAVDLQADNGVVHVIEDVLLPRKTVVDIIVNSPDHEILETAVVAADLAGTLSGDGPFTVFAPTDEAFNALGQATIDALLDDPMGDLTTILTYHVVSGTVLSTDLSNGDVTMLSGETITVSIDNGVVINGNAMVTVADLTADNGVVHVLDAVLLPASVATEELLPADFIFTISPNPSADNVRIAIDEVINGRANLELYDLSGQLLRSARGIDRTVEWDVATLASGQYYLKLVTSQGVAIKALQVQR